MAAFQTLHSWHLTPREAVALQGELRQQVHIAPLDRPIQTIAGCDISFHKESPQVYAGIVVLRLPDLEIIERAGVITTAPFPYVPGLLSFREVPPLLEAWQKLQIEPDAVMLDGQGLAHPRRMGLACHFGLLVHRPTIGCAKSVLVGAFDEPPKERGQWSAMTHKSEVVGGALRTKTNVSPVYVSPGHLIDLNGAIDLALRCDGGYRVPEPTRQAHNFVNGLRRGAATDET